MRNGNQVVNDDTGPSPRYNRSNSMRLDDEIAGRHLKEISLPTQRGRGTGYDLLLCSGPGVALGILRTPKDPPPRGLDRLETRKEKLCDSADTSVVDPPAIDDDRACWSPQGLAPSPHRPVTVHHRGDA